MRINEDKLPIKYILGIEASLEGYPTSLDVLHHEVSLCVKSPDRNKGTFTLHALNKYHFPDTKIGGTFLPGIIRKMYLENSRLQQAYFHLKDREKILPVCLQVRVDRKEPTDDFIM